MFKGLLIRLFQVLEAYGEEGASGVFRKSLSVKETAVKTRMTLDKWRKGLQPKNSNAECLEIWREVLDSRQLRYVVKSRCLKAQRNLDLGYKGFVLVNGDEVMGDVWYVENANGLEGKIHPDLAWLDIQLGPQDVYMFDMFLRKEHRGGGTARLLLIGALTQLREKGFRRAYGYYISQNIPALWIHRTMGYEELSRIEVKRTLGRYRRVGG